MTTWISRLPRLRDVFARYRADPYMRGRTSEVVAAALLADGLVGLENPLRGRDKRPGILGALVLTAIGLLVITVLSGLLHQGDPYANGATADGVISGVIHQRSTNGGNLCSGTVSYTVVGRAYQAESGSSSGALCSEQGTHVPVSYLAANPAAGRPQFAETATVQRMVTGVGWVLFILGALTTLLKLAEIVIGIVLFSRGRHLVRTNEPVPAGQLLDDLKVAWNG